MPRIPAADRFEVINKEDLPEGLHPAVKDWIDTTELDELAVKEVATAAQRMIDSCKTAEEAEALAGSMKAFVDGENLEIATRLAVEAIEF